ncbi:hypothetical protein GUJ93_ZPchr0012g22128 [Zizania palustris]|uniref:Uncharacterized protein n=1 Tax=Zizania palustris TaxID=103762 RepID=A0A8J5WXA9_ZIZPA|nr:hypothetical protein GUJ93_ZPchr0012g22128 [Zizania palustris]
MWKAQQERVQSMRTHEAQGKKRWKVVKDANDEYSDREWEDMEVVMEKEVVKRIVVAKERMMMLVVMVVET